MDKMDNDREKKGCIVYTSGDWDLFHYGHLRFLEAASKAGDKLIVGVGTDEAYREYRGKEPIIPYEQRRAIVESLRFVDEAVPFESYEQSIELMKVKGVTIRAINEPSSRLGGSSSRGNYAEHPEWKGDLEYAVIPRTPNISTTMIRERVKRR